MGAIGWLWVDDDIKPIRRVFLSDSRNAWDSRDWSLDWDLATLCKVARGHLEAVFVSGCFVLLVFRSRYLADFVRSGISKLRQMGMKTIRATLTLGIASLAIQAGQACSACSVADEETRYAYYATTALLSFLPLFMIGGVVFYIAKKGR